MTNKQFYKKFQKYYDAVEKAEGDAFSFDGYDLPDDEFDHQTKLLRENLDAAKKALHDAQKSFFEKKGMQFKGIVWKPFFC